MNLIGKRSTQASFSALCMSVVAGLINPDGASAVIVTREAPNVIVANSSVVGSTVVNTFETVAISNIPSSYGFNFTDATTTHSYTAVYDKLLVDNYGSNTQTAGAGYTGKFMVNRNPLLSTTTLTFTDNDTANLNAGVKYVGLFFSSLDPGNQLRFYNGTTELATLSISNFATLIGGNDAPFKGGPFGEPGAFFNFYADTGEEFTSVKFDQNGTTGNFENDNHTFRVPNAIAISGAGVNLAGLSFTGNVTSTPVPEPFSIIGTLIGGTAAFRMKKKLKPAIK